VGETSEQEGHGVDDCFAMFCGTWMGQNPSSVKATGSTSTSCPALRAVQYSVYVVTVHAISIFCEARNWQDCQ